MTQNVGAARTPGWERQEATVLGLLSLNVFSEWKIPTARKVAVRLPLIILFIFQESKSVIHLNPDMVKLLLLS